MFIILMALNGHFLTHAPHPMQRISEMVDILEGLVTVMQGLPVLLIGQERLHSNAHWDGLQMSGLMIARRVVLGFVGGISFFKGFIFFVNFGIF